MGVHNGTAPKRLSFQVHGNSYATYALGAGHFCNNGSGTCSGGGGWDDTLTGTSAAYQSYAQAFNAPSAPSYSGSSDRATYGVGDSGVTHWDCTQGSAPDITAQVNALMSQLAQCQ